MRPALKRFYTQLLSMLFPPRDDERTLIMSDPQALISSLPPAPADAVLGSLDAHACVAYKDPRVRTVVRLLKYRGNRDVAHICGQLLGEALLELLSDAALFDAVSTPLLVPIPLSRERFRERGFNQAARLAEALLQHSDESLTYLPKALTRKHTTTPQARTRSKRERLSSMQGVFSANKKLVCGRDIVVLDDVVTTGATMRDAKRALKEAGARHVYCIALAH